MKSRLLHHQWEKDSSPRILIVLLGAIGDVTRALPLVGRIRKQWPKAIITWAVETSSCDLVKSCEFVDNVIEFERSKGILAYFKFIKTIRKSSYDVTLDLQRHFKSGLTSYLAGSDKRVGFNYQNSREFNWIFNNYSIEAVDHFDDKIEQFMLFGDLLSVEKTRHPYDYGISVGVEEEREFLARIDSKFPDFAANVSNSVLFLIGSTWNSRKWEASYYVDCANEIYDKYKIYPIIIGSKGDTEMGQEISTAVKVPIYNLINHTSLKDFRILCNLSKFGVGSDSGPLHIASGLGLKVISFWGPTNPTRSKPYQNFVYAIRSPIGCQGCYQKICPGLNKLCMTDIKPNVVLKMVDDLLTGENPT